MLLEYVQIESQGGGIRFRYRDTPEVDSMFTDRVPAAMEAVFQGGAAFGQETRGIMALPTGIAEVTFFHAGAMPKDGELHCVNVSQDGPEGRTVFTFNGFVRDTEGRVMIEFTGVQMMEAEARESFPAHVFECMESVKEIAAKIDDTEGSLADKFLQPEEAEELGRKATPKRAAEWLAGRIAMKRVVRKIAGLSSQAFPDEREIRIAQDAQGKPFAQIDTMPDDRICDLSLSHSNGLAMAAAVLPNVFGGIGIDVEKIEERTDSWVQDYFTEEEIRSAGSTDSRWLDLTKMWSLKEAALKAMGTGLRFDLRDIAVTGMDEYGSATLEFRNEALRCFETGFGGEVIAKVEEQGNLVVARVLIRS
jgi:phosphopantetheine--protein transferase-like protein